MQKLSEIIDSLPSVDEIKAYGNDTEKLAKVNSILNDIAEFTEKNDIEPTEEQAETLTAVADAVNEASAMTLDAQDSISGEVTITSDTKISTDTTASLIIPSGKNITLTIDEGATLTNIAGKHTITVQSGGTLNITGGGTIDNISHARAALEIEAGGTAVINEATLTRSKENGKSAQDSGGNSFYVIRNHGDLTIENATVSQDGQFSSMIENGYYDNSTENTTHNTPTLTIENGKFYGGLNTIKNDDAGILDIKGGEFTNVAQCAVYNVNKAEISGGTFTNTSNNKYPTILNIYADPNVDVGDLIITDGTINGYIESIKGSKLAVDGGNITKGIYVNKEIDELSIQSEPEKDGYTFIGWFDRHTGNEYTDDLNLTDDAYFMPVFTENKVKSDSTTDVPSENATDTTINDAVAEIIKNNGSSTTSDVEINTDKADLGTEIKNAIKAGKAIGTQLDISSVSESSLSEAELTAIKDLAGNDNIALITDISIDMNIDGSKVANITKLPNNITITMDIPTTLQSGNRNFSVIRIHNGKAEILPTTVIAGGTKVSFRTDRFSTYALIYSDISNGGSGTRNSERSRSTADNGTWLQDNNGWWFRETDGSYPKDQWFECTWNGNNNWYHFNANGYADCGWFTDKDGQRYFLHEQHDGKFGFMYTGWNQISGQWYYFNTVTKAGAFEVASKGSLVTNGMTPDGYRVDANGAWVK